MNHILLEIATLPVFLHLSVSKIEFIGSQLTCKVEVFRPFNLVTPTHVIVIHDITPLPRLVQYRCNECNTLDML